MLGYDHTCQLVKMNNTSFSSVYESCMWHVSYHIMERDLFFFDILGNGEKYISTHIKDTDCNSDAASSLSL